MTLLKRDPIIAILLPNVPSYIFIYLFIYLFFERGQAILITRKGVYLFRKPNQILIALLDRVAQDQLPKQKHLPKVVKKKLFWKSSQILQERNFDEVLSWILAAFAFLRRTSIQMFSQSSGEHFWTATSKKWQIKRRLNYWKGSQLMNNIVKSYGFIYWSVKRAYCSSLSDLGYKNGSVVSKNTMILKS